MTRNAMPKGIKKDKSQNNLLIKLISGSIIISLLYVFFLLITAKLNLASNTTNCIATLVFIVIYFSFFAIIKSKNIKSIIANKTLMLNIGLLLVPFIISGIFYALIRSFLGTIVIFFFTQIVFTIYYNNFVPVPGYKKAYKLFKFNRVEESKAILNQILSRYPNSFETLILLGHVYFKDLEYDKAIDVLEKAKFIRPEDAMSYLNLSNAYTAIENFDRAIENSKMITELLPDQWNAFYTIGLCYLLNGNNNESINHFKKTLEFDLPEKQKFLVYYGLAKNFQLLKNNYEYDKAIKSYIKFADESTISFWKSQLQKINTNTNKPSDFVKEAVEHITEHQTI